MTPRQCDAYASIVCDLLDRLPEHARLSDDHRVAADVLLTDIVAAVYRKSKMPQERRLDVIEAAADACERIERGEP
jgi:hypothetical protein